jgi:hypothetical protein
MIKRIALAAVILGLLLTGISPVLSPAAAQEPVTVASSVQMDFPMALNFQATINSGSGIADIRLRYRTEQMGFARVTTEAFVPFNPGSTINARYTLDLRRTGGLPPGTVVHYWWVLKDRSGSFLETGPQQFTVSDNRYNWQKLSQGKVNIYWYRGDNSFAQSLMSKAQQSLEKLAEDTGASPENPINIYIYGSAEDLRGSLIYPQEWTGGVAFTQYNIIAIGISPGDLDWGLRAMTHELTHNVINQVTFNPYGELPVWLNEGLAMYGEGELTPQFAGPLREAVSNNTLISVRSLASPFSAFTEMSLLSYAQSYSLVDYLIQQYGPTRMQELLNTFQQGSTYDAALKKVYGLDMDGLDTEWRAWAQRQFIN